MRKKLVLLLIALIVLGVFSGCKKKNVNVDVDSATKNQDHSNDPLVPSDVNIDTTVYEDKEGDVLYNIAKIDQIILPERYIENNPKMVDAIDIYNAERDTEGKNFIDEQKQEIRTMRVDRNDDTLVLSYEDVVNVNRIDDDVFSFMEEISSYTGGPHGNNASIGRNYNVKEGVELTSEDIFTDKNKLKDILVEKIVSSYGEEELFPEWKETLDAHINENKLFNILVGDEFVDVMFDPYYLAPWATGTITVTLLYKDNKNILNEKYFR